MGLGVAAPKPRWEVRIPRLSFQNKRSLTTRIAKKRLVCDTPRINYGLDGGGVDGATAGEAGPAGMVFFASVVPCDPINAGIAAIAKSRLATKSAQSRFETGSDGGSGSRSKFKNSPRF